MNKRGNWLFLFLPIILVLQIDIIVIPFFTKQDNLTNLQIFGIVSVLATFELIYWYWFWQKIRMLALEREKIKESIEFTKDLAKELKKEGYVDRFVNFFLEKYSKVIKKDNWIIRLVKVGSYFSTFIICVSPEWGGRIFCVIWCGTFNWRKGFYVVLIGNVIRLTYLILGWKYFWRFWDFLWV